MNPYPCTHPGNSDFGAYLAEALRYASLKQRARIKREYGLEGDLK